MQLRIVLVDDAELIRRLLRTLFSQAGHVVVAEADDGRAGVDQTEAVRPDLVIMDWSMPVLDGVAATRAIRERWPGVAVIAFSSAAGAGVREEFLAAGAVDYVDKADLAGLMRAVRAVASRAPCDRAVAGGAASPEPAPEEALTIVVRNWPALAWTHIAVGGALDAGSAEQLRAAVIEHSHPGDTITLHLSEITAIDEAGASAIQACDGLARARDARLEIEHASPVARRALRQRDST